MLISYLKLTRLARLTRLTRLSAKKAPPWAEPFCVVMPMGTLDIILH